MITHSFIVVEVLASFAMAECHYGKMTKGVPTCSQEATHTGGGYYPGPVCEEHADEDCEPLDK